MKLLNGCELTLLAKFVRLASISSLLLLSYQLNAAEVVNGVVRDVDASGPKFDWDVRSGGTLNATGTLAGWIRVERSTVNLTGATLDGTHNSIGSPPGYGLSLLFSNGTIVGSNITGSEIGAQITGGSATITGSAINGGLIGMDLRTDTDVTLVGSQVNGTGATAVGVNIFDGTLNATQGSVITGVQNGITVTQGLIAYNPTINLDNSRVEGQTGSAIVLNAPIVDVENFTQINVSNGSTLVGGNGTLLEANGAKGRMNVNNSTLNRGLLVQDTVHDWQNMQDLPLTTTYLYDDWGEQRSMTGPDGVEQHKVVDPIDRTTTEWKAGSGKTITLKNLFDKPESIERQTAAGQRISLETNVYDGLGRTFGQFDALGNYRQFSYDAFDRLISNLLPGNALVERSYALHSKEDLPTSISVDGVVLGEQAFDGLERMISSTTGGRHSTYDFVAGQLQPSQVLTPRGETIDYVYQPQLGEQPIQRRTVSSTANYTYDPQNARLLTSKEQDQELERDYYSNGELKEERRVQGGQNYVMRYEYSLEGRILSYTDVLGATQSYRYDGAGRLEQTEVAQLESHFSYNPLGQLERIQTTDTSDNRSLTISLEYDDAGREVVRRFSLPGGVEQVLEQFYDAADHLQQRILKEGTTALRDETFEYDPRGRLEHYTASGPQAPVDPQGKQIQSQLFRFDALDNILEVQTTFAGGSNTATYEFANQDPTQLSAVRNSHADYPAEVLLSYDDDGNLVSDEVGRLLEYDALDRLVSVSVSVEDDSHAVSYGYDAQDSLTSASGSDSNEQRFYRDGQVINQLDGQHPRSFIRAGDTLLGERVSETGGEGDALHLVVTDAKKTVLVEVDSTSATDRQYTAYGHHHPDAPAACHSGFNGEPSEFVTGWYLLGQGYRAYNPVLMRFHSADNLSPFGKGGLNAYAYCLGDPVNYRDPDGHVPSWLWPALGIALSIVGAVMTLGAGAPLGIAGAVSLASGAAGVASGTTSLAMPESSVGEILGYVSIGLGAVSAVSGVARNVLARVTVKTTSGRPPTAVQHYSGRGSARPGPSRSPAPQQHAPTGLEEDVRQFIKDRNPNYDEALLEKATRKMHRSLNKDLETDIVLERDEAKRIEETRKYLDAIDRQNARALAKTPKGREYFERRANRLRAQ